MRGFDDPEDAKSFLRPFLDDLSPPDVLEGMRPAVDRILEALEEEETILVHGDYDVDGISGTALLTRWLRRLGGRVVPFVPDRLRDGYDFGNGGLRAAREAGATLVVTVDCGIRAHGAVDRARAEGMDVVVTDHHQPGETLPAAAAVVNPSLGQEASPGPLSGTGVVYKLCQALAGEPFARDRGVSEKELHPHLDLVALATVADLVPLEGENRTLVRFGLKALRQTNKVGLQALMEAAEVAPETVDAGKVGFVLAPRINAAGRIGDAGSALRLLLTSDPREAASLAEELEETNRARRDVDRRVLDEALALLAQSYDPERDYGVVLASRDWHPGVIGIVASRLVERIHRPVVMVALDGDTGRGSARSISGFHLARALESCEEHLVRYGGHARAAGLDVQARRLDDFRAAFAEEARRHLADAPLRPELEIDLEVDLGEADEDVHRFVEYFGPFGVGNPRPVFLARGVRPAVPARVVGSGHLKLQLSQGEDRLEAIGFGLADRIRPDRLAEGPLDIVFQLRENHYRGRTTLQARLLDVRSAE